MSVSRVSRTQVAALVALVVLVVAMLLSTKFLTSQALADALPKPFNPAKTAEDLFARGQTAVPGKARPLEQVQPALQKDIKGAARTFGAVSPSDGSYVFPVTVTGTVESASTPDALRLGVAGLPSGGGPVLVPLTNAINGTALRDAMGFKFADAPGQTEFQFVGDELKKLIQSKVVQPLGDPSGLKGKKVSVIGLVTVTAAGSNTVPAAKPVNIQPIKIEVAP